MMQRVGSMWSGRARVGMLHATQLLFFASVIAVGCDRAGVAELQFATRESIENAIDKGWLPEWLPKDSKNLRGVQETFDGSFVWLSLDLDAELESIVKASCDRHGQSSADLPDAEFMRRFSAEIVDDYWRVSSKGMAHYSCAETGREFRVAMDSVESKAYLWSN